jgi:hypothetical protein
MRGYPRDAPASLEEELKNGAGLHRPQLAQRRASHESEDQLVQLGAGIGDGAHATAFELVRTKVRSAERA